MFSWKTAIGCVLRLLVRRATSGFASAAAGRRMYEGARHRDAAASAHPEDGGVEVTESASESWLSMHSFRKVSGLDMSEVRSAKRSVRGPCFWCP